MKGIIFDIKEFTIHDGPASRISVFLKGCPLRCKWCHNPEGLALGQQLMFKKTFCNHCRVCEKPCHHEECQPFSRCVHVCPNGCLSIVGEEIESETLAQTLLKNAGILKLMGGGITITGGEPLLQADFVCELASHLTPMHKAIQTSAFAEPETYQRVIHEMDYVLQDIKIVDQETHRKYTGVKNDKILNNIEWLKRSGKEFVFRLPLIPGITDTEENLRAVSEIVENHRIELMPYNEFAGVKYPMVDMEYSLDHITRKEEDYGKYFSNVVLLG